MEELAGEIKRRMGIIESYSRNYAEYLRRGDYAKASEMLWEIVNNLASILSILYGGKPISKHDELRSFVNSLAAALKREDIVRWFRACERLHSNFFHNFMDEETFGEYRAEAEKLIDALQRLVAEKLRELGISL